MGRLTVDRLTLSGTGANIALVPTRLHSDIPIQGSNFTKLFRSRDRLLLLSSVLDHVRVWDIQELVSEKNADLQDREPEVFVVHSLASTVRDELYAGVGTSDGGRVVALNCTNGAVLWKGPAAQGRIMALATGPEEMDHSLVAAQGGVIHVFDTDSDSIPPLLRSLVLFGGSVWCTGSEGTFCSRPFRII
jgi:hypothetical protein